MNIEKFTDLEVWQLSRELSKLIGDISSEANSIRISDLEIR